MNIAFVNSTHNWGGVKTWTIRMARDLTSLGHRCMILGRSGVFIEQAKSVGLDAREVVFGADYNPILIHSLWKIFRRNGFERVVVNVSKDLRTAGIAALLAGIPVCHRVGAVGDIRNTLHSCFDHALLRPKLMACSEFVRQGLLKQLPFLAAGDIKAIHPGKEPAPQPPATCGTPRVIVTTSRLEPDKGHHDLLEALATLKAEFDFRVIICGTGSAEARLRKAADRLGLSNRIIWTGFITNVEIWLSKGDIFALPTFCEPLGQSLQEALAQGLAPVARSAGGVPEIFPPALAFALLCSPQEGPVGLARCLRNALAANEDTLLTWKRQAWEQARTAFHHVSQAKIFASWLDGFHSDKNA